MKRYLVGGAVRDILSGTQPADRDWVVVNSTPAEMLALGYKQVGADFPVFLHPQTGEEHALARTERKVGSGYRGFETSHGSEVTLEEDLRRRDFTINAMAMDEHGQIIDPFGGRKDLESGLLRATSEAFEDDPLRVLRLARFAAAKNFAIDGDTLEMSRRIARRSEFAELTAERVSKELLKALGTDRPDLFFITLHDANALDVHFPEISALIGQTQPAKHHPEGDAFAHTMLVLRQAVRHGLGVTERFSALVHDLGKGLTPAELLPAHHDHEAAGVPLVETLCNRLKLSNELRKPAMLVTEFHGHVHKILELNPKTITRLLLAVEADRGRRFAEMLADVSMCDARGRGPTLEDDDYPEHGAFLQLADAFAAVKARNLLSPEQIRDMAPEQIRNNLHAARVKAMREMQASIVANNQAASAKASTSEMIEP
jgi:tRNA nucleotidyltransferase (CCA-adding enzyme)